MDGFSGGNSTGGNVTGDDIRNFLNSKPAYSPDAPVWEYKTDNPATPGFEEGIRRDTAAGLMVDRPDDEHEALLRERGLSGESLAAQMGQYRMSQARKRYQGTSPGGTLEQFKRNALPFGDVFDAKGDVAYAEALKKFQAGDASPEVVDQIARYERLQERDAEVGSTFSGQLLQSGQSVLKMVGEGWAAGKVVGLAGRALPGKAGRALSGETAGLASQFAKTGAMMPLMPSMYLGEMRSRNLEAGREVNDLRGLPGPYLFGWANLMVLNRLQNRVMGSPKARPSKEQWAAMSQAERRAAGITTSERLGPAGTIVGSGVLGAVEMQIAEAAGGLWDEVAPEILQTRTKYGPLGMLARGEAGEALQHFAVTAFTFSLFSGLHYKNPREARLEALKRVRQARDRFNADVAKGMSERRAAELETARLEEEARVEVNKKEAGLYLAETTGRPQVTRGGELPPGLAERVTPPEPPQSPSAGLGLADVSGRPVVTRGGETPPGLGERAATPRSPSAGMGLTETTGRPVVTRGERPQEEGEVAERPVETTTEATPPPEGPPLAPVEPPRPKLPEPVPEASPEAGPAEAKPGAKDGEADPEPTSGRSATSALSRWEALKIEKNLTPEQVEVLEAYARGLTFKEIGAELGISAEGARSRQVRAMARLGKKASLFESLFKGLKAEREALGKKRVVDPRAADLAQTQGGVDASGKALPPVKKSRELVGAGTLRREYERVVDEWIKTGESLEKAEAAGKKKEIEKYQKRMGVLAEEMTALKKRMDDSGATDVLPSPGGKAEGRDETMPRPGEQPNRYQAFLMSRRIREREGHQEIDPETGGAYWARDIDIEGMYGIGADGYSKRALEAAQSGKHRKAAELHEDAANAYDRGIADAKRWYENHPDGPAKIAEAEAKWGELSAMHFEASLAHNRLGEKQRKGREPSEARAVTNAVTAATKAAKPIETYAPNLYLSIRHSMADLYAQRGDNVAAMHEHRSTAMDIRSSLLSIKRSVPESYEAANAEWGRIARMHEQAAEAHYERAERRAFERGDGVGLGLARSVRARSETELATYATENLRLGRPASVSERNAIDQAQGAAQIAALHSQAVDQTSGRNRPQNPGENADLHMQAATAHAEAARILWEAYENLGVKEFNTASEAHSRAAHYHDRAARTYRDTYTDRPMASPDKYGDQAGVGERSQVVEPPVDPRPLPPASNPRLQAMESRITLEHDVPSQQLNEYMGNFRDAFEKLNPDVQDRMVEVVREVKYFPDHKTMTESVFMAEVEFTRKHNHPESHRRAAEDRFIAAMDGRIQYSGVYFDGALYLDGAAIGDVFGGKHNTKGKTSSGVPWTTQFDIFIHEIGHSIDTQGFVYSDSRAWVKAFRKDIDVGVLNSADWVIRGRLSDYARTNRQEGFAEAFRVIHSLDKAGLARFSREMPAVTRFFKDMGLWPTTGARTGSKAAAEVFDTHIDLPSGNHIDAKTGGVAERPVASEGGKGDFEARDAEARSLSAEAIAEVNKIRDKYGILSGSAIYENLTYAARRGNHVEAARLHDRFAQSMEGRLEILKRYPEENVDQMSEIERAIALHKRASDAHAEAALRDPKNARKLEEARDQDWRPNEAMPEDFYSGPLPSPGRVQDIPDLHSRGHNLKRVVGAFFRKHFTGPGDAPPKSFEILLDKDASISEAGLSVGNAVRDYIEMVGGDLRSRTPEQIELHNRALEDKEVMKTLPIHERAALSRMRYDIDRFTDKLLAAGVISDRLIAVVDANKGVYLTRHYEVHTNPGWEAKLRSQHPERLVAFKNWFNAEARRMGREVMGERELDNFVSAFLANQIVPENLRTILMPRGDLAKPLRDVMGEVRDPVANYAMTIGRQAHLLANHVMQKRLLDTGLASGWIAAPGDFSKAGLTEVLTSVSGKSGILPSTVTGSMGVLEGYRTTPEIKAALEAHYSPEANSKFMRHYMKVLGVFKYGKTVLSPIAHLRQILGNPSFVLRNGYGFSKEAHKAMMEAYRDTEDGRREHQKWVRLGLDENSVFSREFGAVLKDSFGPSSPFDFSARLAERPLGRAARNLAQLPQKLYRYEDLVPKIHGFYGEQGRIREAHPEWSVEQVESEAARRVLAFYPSYSQLSGTVKSLRRFPVVGPFVSFTSEVIRTTYNTARQAATELRSDNAVERKHGAQRLGGLLATMSAYAALGAASRALAGVTLEEEDAIRKHMPPWSKDGQLLHLGKGEDGKFRVIDLGRTDPHTYLWEPVQAALTGRRSGTYTVADSLTPLATPFIQEELGTRVALDIARNRIETGGSAGRPVYNPEDSRLGQGMDIGMHFLKGAEPGVVSQILRTGSAATGMRNPRTGREYTVADELLADLTGQRVIIVDPAESLMFKARTYTGRMSDSTRALTTEVSRQRRIGMAPSPESVAGGYSRAEEMRSQVFDDLLEDVRAVKMMGLSQAEIAKALKAGGISADDVGIILGGKYRQRPVAEYLRPRR